MSHPPYVDMHKFSEDQRIHYIGHTLTCKDCKKRNDGKPTEVALLLDDDEKKIKRYVEKLLKQFPGVRVIGIFPGPVPGAKTLKLAGPLDG